MSDAVFISRPAVLKRYSVSTMTLYRWLQDADLAFPRPIKVRDKNYFRITELEALEKRQVGRKRA